MIEEQTTAPVWRASQQAALNPTLEQQTVLTLQKILAVQIETKAAILAVLSHFRASTIEVDTKTKKGRK